MRQAARLRPWTVLAAMGAALLAAGCFPDYYAGGTPTPTPITERRIQELLTLDDLRRFTATPIKLGAVRDLHALAEEEELSQVDVVDAWFAVIYVSAAEVSSVTINVTDYQEPPHAIRHLERVRHVLDIGRMEDPIGDGSIFKEFEGTGATVVFAVGDKIVQILSDIDLDIDPPPALLIDGAGILELARLVASRL